MLTLSRTYCQIILTFQCSYQTTFSESYCEINWIFFRVHIKVYWHFYRITIKQYWLFQCSHQTILALSSFIELLPNNTDFFQTSNTVILRELLPKNSEDFFQSSHQALLTWLKKILIRRCRMSKTLK